MNILSLPDAAKRIADHGKKHHANYSFTAATEDNSTFDVITLRNGEVIARVAAPAKLTPAQHEELATVLPATPATQPA